MADGTTEKLTACKDCKHGDDSGQAPSCLSGCGPIRFDAWSGMRVNPSTIPRCVQINTDGHCDKFEAKQ
ncbi:MAG: hypothetical protein O7D91_17635 [Planctomycetota bacterium]|nr:hypothetical protein [Planctomycetota bacterium]